MEADFLFIYRVYMISFFRLGIGWGRHCVYCVLRQGQGRTYCECMYVCLFVCMYVERGRETDSETE